MRPRDLNLAYLRRLRAPNLPNGLQDGVAEFTRRGFLQMSALTALASCSDASRDYLSRDLGFLSGPGRFTIGLGGEERFAIHARRFSGRPKLSVSSAPSRYLISLNNARFAGLALPADLDLDLWEGLFGWNYRLYFKGLGLVFRGDLKQWLAGGFAAKSQSNASVDVGSGPGWNVRIAGPFSATFRPDWTLEFKAKAVGETTLEEASLKSDVLIISSPDAPARSLMRRPPKRRSVVSLTRGGHSWTLFPSFASTAQLQLERLDVAGSSVFQRLTIEAGESLSHGARSAFVAESDRDAASLRARPMPAFVAANGHPFEMEFRDVHYAGAFESGARYLTAHLPQAPTWLHLGSLNVALSSSDDSPTLEAYQLSAARPPTVNLRTRTAVAADVPGAVVATAQIPSSSSVPLSFGNFFCRAGYYLHLDCEHQTAYSSAQKLRVHLLRPKDLVNLELEFSGMRLEHSWGKSYLVPSGAKEESKITVNFPPQSIAEQSPYLDDPSCASPSTPNAIPNETVRTRLSQPSRLVFRPFARPDSPQRLSFEIDDLLDWSQWQIAVGKFANPPRDQRGQIDLQKAQQITKPLAAPSALETAIELPYRIIISPEASTRFRGTRNPDTNGSSKQIELWHAALNSDAGSPTAGNVRVIWTREGGTDFCPKQTIGGKDVCAVPMDAEDRKSLLYAFTTYTGTTYQGSPYYPPAIATRMLALSALGGWFDGTAKWDPAQTPVPQKLGSWRQVTEAGRDGVVELGIPGYLVPTGHAVTLIRIAQREWVNKQEQRYGYLVKRCYIQVNERSKTYPAAGQLNSSRDLPFRKIDITCDVSPYLDPESCVATGATWPKVCGALFRFPLQVTDFEGRLSRCTLAMQFVPIDQALGTGDALAATLCAYMSSAEPDVCSLEPPAARGSLFHGQKVAFAPSARAGDTSFSLQRLVWGISQPDAGSAAERQGLRQPAWYPALDQACIGLDGAQEFGRKSYAARVRYARPYVQNGFPSGDSKANSGEVLLQVIPAGTPAPSPAGCQAAPPSSSPPALSEGSPVFSFPGESSAGLALPSARVGAISRRFGILGGTGEEAVGAASEGRFDPASFFKNANATLLGAIDLADLIGSIANMVDQEARVPKLIRQEIRDAGAQYMKFRAELNQVPDRLNDIVAAFAPYIQAASQTADALWPLGPQAIGTSQIANAVSQIRNATIYDVIPPDLRVPAEQAAGTVQKIRSDFSAALSERQMRPDAPISLIREYTVFEVTKNPALPFDDASLQNFRETFRIGAEQKLSLIEAAVRDAASQLRQPVGKRLSELQAQLKSALDKANPEMVIASLNALKGVIDDIQTANSAVDRVRRELTSIASNCNARVDEFRAALHGDISRIETQLLDARWRLTAAAQQAVKSRLDLYEKTLTAKLDTVRSTIAAQLYDAEGKIAGRLPQEVDRLLGPRSAVIQQRLADVLPLLRDVLTGLMLPTEVHVTYDFEPQIHDAPSGNPIFRASTSGTAAALTIHAALRKRFDGSEPESLATTALSNFELRLFPFAPFLELAFKRIEFKSENGHAPTVVVKIAGSRFVGPLDFIKRLQDQLHGLSGDSNVGPYLTVSAAALQSGFRFSIPSISTGAFNLSDIKFNTALQLPFAGDATRLRFSFSDRSRPFQLSFGIFGGGGFFGLEATARNIEQVEGALEFGAVAKLDLGVAHGGVQIMGGFYFRQRAAGLMLSGYVRAGGELNILGLVSMSIQFFLSLSLEQRSNVSYLVGECSVTVEIGFTFFSVSVRLTLRKEFAGDPPGEPAATPTSSAALAGLVPGVLDLANAFSTDLLPDWRTGYRAHLESYAW